jgi:hypothetical protein
MPDNERVLIVVCRESGLGFISVVNINIVVCGYSAESVSSRKCCFRRMLERYWRYVIILFKLVLNQSTLLFLCACMIFDIHQTTKALSESIDRRVLILTRTIQLSRSGLCNRGCLWNHETLGLSLLADITNLPS